MPDLVQPEPPKKPQEELPTERPASATWMYDHTIAYKELVAHSSFLQTFKDYVTELQQQQLDKSKLGAKAPAAPKPAKPTKPRLTQAKPIPVNLKDAHQNLRNVHNYNSTQAAVSQEINDLEELIQEMISLDPSMAKVLAGPLGQLQAMAKSFPALSSADMKNLTNMFKLLENMAAGMSISHQRLFYQSMIKMMKSLQDINSSNLNAQKALLQKLKSQYNMIIEYVDLAMAIAKEFKSLGSTGHMSEAQLLQVLSQLRALSALGKKLDPAEQTALKNYLKQIAAITVTVPGHGSEPIAEVLASALVTEWMKNCPYKPSQFANSRDFFEHVGEYLDKELQASGLAGDSGPILDQVNNWLSPTTPNTIIGAFLHGYNFIAGCDVQWFTLVDNKVTVNPNPMGPVTSTGTFQNNTSPAIEQYLTALDQSITPWFKQLGAQIDETSESITDLTQLGGEYGSALGWAYYEYAHLPSGGGGGNVTPKKGKSGGSLADQVANDVINRYMPRQQAYLEALAFMLMFDNLGATIGNDLLNNMTAFPNAGNQFNFANTYLNKEAGKNYSGSAKSAQAQLSTEKANASASLKNLNDANNKINEEISKIKASHVSESKKRAMINSLVKLQGQIQQSITDVKNLQANLDSMKITAVPGKSPPEFSITFSGGKTMNTLNSAENATSNALQSVYTNTNSFQSFYSSGVTTQQAGLQVAMTEIQQEWTIVSTVLQLLNQSYMAFAQGIYKG